MFLVYEIPSYNLGMMENTPLNSLLIKLLRRTTLEFPSFNAEMEAYLEAKAKAEERDENGKLTQAARAAREMLRNPLLVQMPIKRTRRVRKKKARMLKAKAEKAVAEALLAVFEHDQSQTELDILDEYDPRSENDIPPCRERQDQDKIDAMVRPFIDALRERNISPSTIGRLSALFVDLFAKLIADLRNDPDIESPENLWGRMFRAGILDAFVDAMTSDEAAVIQYASSRHCFDGLALEFAEKAREACGLPAGFSTDFLEGAYYLRSGLDDISEGTSRAYARSLRLSRDRDIELLGEVLGLPQDADLERLQAIAAYLRQRNRYEFDDLQMTIQIAAVRNEFNRLDAHNRCTEDWARDVPKMIASLADDFSDTVPNPEAFDMLLWSGFRLSSTYEELERRREQRQEEERRDIFLDSIRQACVWNFQFKITGDTILMEGQDGFEELDTRVWDQATWEAEHGRLFSDSHYENADHGPASDEKIVGRDAPEATSDDIGHVASRYPCTDDSNDRLGDTDAPSAPSPSSSDNLPAIVIPQQVETGSLFDFNKPVSGPSHEIDTNTAAGSRALRSANRARPLPRKSIDKLTDEDFR